MAGRARTNVTVKCSAAFHLTAVEVDYLCTDFFATSSEQVTVTVVLDGLGCSSVLYTVQTNYSRPTHTA